jgi:hypothetical protein
MCRASASALRMASSPTESAGRISVPPSGSIAAILRSMATRVDSSPMVVSGTIHS